MKVASARGIRGTVSLPGDKSISHRAALFAAIADGTTVIENYSSSADCRATLGCLTALGVGVEHAGSRVVIKGVGPGGLCPPAGPLDCGNSGTTMRLLAGILAGQAFESVLTGDESLSRRPMERMITPLEAMGAEISSNNGHAPLSVRGKAPLNAITYEMPVASAQVKSCVLLAGLFADGRTTVMEPVGTRDHTERLLEWFGGDISIHGREISVSAAAPLTARDVSVPGDISSAAFYMIAAACFEGSEVAIDKVGLNPTRTAVLGVLEEAGVAIGVSDRLLQCNEPAGSIRIRGGIGSVGRPVAISGGRTAALIDELPVLAVLGTRLAAGLEVRDAAELRVKESDRIAAIEEDLRRMGADIEAYEDGFRVGRSDLRGSRVDAFGDHRIAMAMAVAGLIADGETEILGAECVDVSFPGFFDVLRSVVI